MQDAPPCHGERVGGIGRRSNLDKESTAYSAARVGKASVSDIPESRMCNPDGGMHGAANRSHFSAKLLSRSGNLTETLHRPQRYHRKQ
jgi:hypothetical protein